jgi:hypothetical protein
LSQCRNEDEQWTGLKLRMYKLQEQQQKWKKMHTYWRLSQVSASRKSHRTEANSVINHQTSHSQCRLAVTSAGSRDGQVVGNYVATSVNAWMGLICTMS